MAEAAPRPEELGAHDPGANFARAHAGIHFGSYRPTGGSQAFTGRTVFAAAGSAVGDGRNERLARPDGVLPQETATQTRDCFRTWRTAAGLRMFLAGQEPAPSVPVPPEREARLSARIQKPRRMGTRSSMPLGPALLNRPNRCPSPRRRNLRAWRLSAR